MSLHVIFPPHCQAVITTVLTLLPSLLVLSFPLPYRSEFLLASNISYLFVVCSNNRQPGLTHFLSGMQATLNFETIQVISLSQYYTRYEMFMSSLREYSVYKTSCIHHPLEYVFNILLYILINWHKFLLCLQSQAQFHKKAPAQLEHVCAANNALMQS